MFVTHWLARVFRHPTPRTSGLQGRPRLGLELLEDRRVPATVFWLNPAGGDWGVGGNWDGGNVPGPQDDAVIPQTGIVISHTLGSHTVNSVVSQSPILFNGGTLTLLRDSSLRGALTLSGGTLLCGGTTTISGPLAWTSGTLAGAGHLRADGGLNISGAPSRFLDGITLDNGGTATWTAGNLLLGNGAVIDNLAGATFQAQARADLTDLRTGAPPIFVNTGTLTLAGTTTFDNVFLDNRGSMVVQPPSSSTNTVTVRGGVTSSGDIRVDAGGTLDCSIGNHLFTTSSHVTGAGVVQFSGEAPGTVGQATVAGTYAVSGTTRVISRGSDTFAAGRVTFQGDATLGTLAFSNGIISGPGNLTVTTLTWTGGQMTGTGQTVVTGTLTISTSADTLLSRTLANAGTATWIGSRFNLTGTLENRAGATFDAQVSAFILSGGTINNAGTFRRSAGTGVLELDGPFLDSGRVEVQTGTLRLQGGSTSSGSFDVSAPATLDFSKGVHNLGSSSSVTGAGTVRFITFRGGDFGSSVVNGRFAPTGATVIQDATVNFLQDVALPRLTLFSQVGGPTVLTGPSTVTVTGLLTWDGATMSGTGRTVANGGIATGNFLGNGLVDRRVTNAGTATWRSPQLRLSGGAVFDNLAGASFLWQAEAAVVTIGGVATDGTFNNFGSLISTSQSLAPTLSTTFTNSGSMEVRARGLLVTGDSTCTGTIQVDANAGLTFAGGGHNLLAGSSFTGAGLVVFSGGAVTIAGTFDVTGSTTVSTGTADFLSDARMGSLTVGSSGTSFARLSGPGNLTVTGRTTWVSGVIEGTGRLRVGGGLDITGSDGKTLNGRTVDNPGTATLAGGNVLLGNGARWNNLAGSVLDIRGDLTFGSGPSRLTNAGTVRRSAGTGTATIGVTAFDNSGAVEVQSGTLSLNGEGTSSGSFTIAAGDTLVFPGRSWVLTSTSTVTGAGNVRFINPSAPDSVQVGGSYDVTGTTVVSGNTVEFLGDARTGALDLSSGVITGSGRLTVSGALTWTGGTMSGTGSTVANGSLDIGGTENLSLDGRRLDNGGTATLTNPHGLALLDGAIVSNLPNGTFVLQTNSTIGGSDPSAFENAGLVRVAGPGQCTFFVPFRNSGTLQVQAGTLQLQRGGSSTGSITVAAGFLEIFARFDLGPTSQAGGAGGWILRSAVTVNGTFDVGGVTVTSFAVVDFQADARIATATFFDGIVTGLGTVTITDQLNCTGTVMSGAGRTVVAGQTTLSGGASWKLDGRTLDNAGTFSWGGFGGSIIMTNGAVINNLPGALFEVVTARSFFWDRIGITPRFNNAGTFRQSSGGTTTVPVAFDNSGVLDIRSGTVNLTGPFDNFDGTSGTLTGGTYQGGGTLQFTNALVLTNAATLVLDGSSRIVNQAGFDALANLTTNAATGSIILQNGRLLNTGAAFTNAGELIVTAGCEFATTHGYTQTGGVTTLQGGTVTAAEGLLLAGGMLSGSGTIQADVVDQATIAVGDPVSAGTLAIQGDYTQTADGILELGLGGLDPVSFDQVTISGQANLDGTLNIALRDDFFPEVGDSFQVMTFGSRAGDFAFYNGLELGGGVFLDPLLDETSLTLVTTAS